MLIKISDFITYTETKSNNNNNYTYTYYELMKRLVKE